MTASWVTYALKFSMDPGRKTYVEGGKEEQASWPGRVARRKGTPARSSEAWSANAQ